MKRPISIENVITPKNIGRRELGAILFHAHNPAFGVSYNDDYEETHLVNIQPDWAHWSDNISNEEVREYYLVLLEGAAIMKNLKLGIEPNEGIPEWIAQNIGTLP
jgi:hypothetical protein